MLNFGGPEFSTTKRENQKGVQFVPGEHREIFRGVAQIYKDTKVVHGIVGPMPILFIEDETKVKGWIAWDHHWDTLSGFCGPNEIHVCVFNFKQIVGSNDEGYNKIMDCFCTNRVFAKIVMVNPLH